MEIDNQSAQDYTENKEGGIIFFDGVCGLCNGWVDFVIRRDKRSLFKFSPLQGKLARTQLAPFHGPRGLLDSMVLFDVDGLHYRSDGVLRTLRGLSGFWKLFYLFHLVPRPLRDAVYDCIARNRYRWFGQRASCRLPTPQEREKFID